MTQLRKKMLEELQRRNVHVVFTLPHQLSQLALQNKQVLYDLFSQGKPTGRRAWTQA